MQAHAKPIGRVLGVRRQGKATWLAEGHIPGRHHCAGWGFIPGSLTCEGLILAVAEIHFEKLQEF